MTGKRCRATALYPCLVGPCAKTCPVTPCDVLIGGAVGRFQRVLLVDCWVVCVCVFVWALRFCVCYTPKLWLGSSSTCRPLSPCSYVPVMGCLLLWQRVHRGPRCSSTPILTHQCICLLQQCACSLSGCCAHFCRVSCMLWLQLHAHSTAYVLHYGESWLPGAAMCLSCFLACGAAFRYQCCNGLQPLVTVSPSPEPAGMGQAWSDYRCCSVTYARQQFHDYLSFQSWPQPIEGMLQPPNPNQHTRVGNTDWTDLTPACRGASVTDQTRICVRSAVL